jgi:hypothetical protein
MYHHPPHRENVAAPHGHPNLTTGRGDHEVNKGHVVALGKKYNYEITKYMIMTTNQILYL